MCINIINIGRVALILLLTVTLPFGPANARTAEKKETPDNAVEVINVEEGGGAEAVPETEEGSNDTDVTEDKEDLPIIAKEEDEISEPGSARFKFKGQAKNLYTFHRTDNFVNQNPLVTSHKNLSANLTRLRLSPEFLYKDNLDIRIDYDNELIASNYGKSMYFKSYWRPMQYNDLLHLAWEPYRSDEVYYRTKIHRAYLRVNADHFSATVGRQQIRFGSGKLWNPLDILNPVSPTFVEGGDEQKGTDAIRLDFYPDDKTEITVVYDMKKSNNKIQHFNMQDCNYVMRVKTSIEDTDVAVLGGYVSRRGMAGFDFAAILFDGMFRGSMIVIQRGEEYLKAFNPWYPVKYLVPGKDEDSSLFFQANAGYEYTFKKGVYFLVEYFYNQRGINYNMDLKLATYASAFNAMDQKTYLQLANQFATVNQHYVAVALAYDFHPLVRGEFFTIGDIQGQGIFWLPALQINAYENLDFTVAMMGAFTFNNRSSDFSEFRKNYLFYASGSYVF
ncbi:MAG: hypothetical protein JW807_06595 [Spirochaetes bacterium]|nr:hypothetical protein [Spirochaetota bacterium]